MEPIPDQSDNRLGFELASVGSRIGARAIDAIIGFGVTLLVVIIVVAAYDIDLDSFTDTSAVPSGAELLLRWGPLVIWGLYEVMLVIYRGQTVGKMVTKIKVIAVSGDDPPQLGPAAIRWGVLALPMALIPGLVGPAISLVAGIWFVWDKNRQGLQDKAGGTYVVKMPAAAS